MCMRSGKLKHLENVSELKKDPFALHSNYSFEIVILVMFLKNCQNLFLSLCLLCPLHFQEEAGVDGGGGGWRCLLNVLSLLRLGIQSREELISKLEEIIIYPF